MSTINFKNCIWKQLSLHILGLIAVSYCVAFPQKTIANEKNLKKTIVLYQGENASAGTVVQVNDTHNIIFTTYSAVSSRHYHTFTYGSGSIQPQINYPYIASLSANTPKEAFHQIPSHNIISTKLSETGPFFQTPRNTLPQQQFFIHGQVYNHGNLAEIKTKLRQPGLATTIFSNKTATPHVDISLMLGQDLTLNTNNKLLLTAELITKNISIENYRKTNRAESESEAVFSILLSNNSFLRKQITATITQPEHQAPTLSASIVYFLYGPRFFNINDIHQPSTHAENIDPLIPY